MSNIFNYVNKNTKTNLSIFKPDNTSGFLHFRNVVLTQHGVQTRKKLKGRFKYDGTVGHFYPHQDDVNTGIFVENLFGINMRCFSIRRNHMVANCECDDYTEISLNRVGKTFGTECVITSLRKFFYTVEDFKFVCETNKLRAVVMQFDTVPHDHYAMKKRHGGIRIVTESVWIVVAGEDIAQHLGYKHSDALIESWKAVVGSEAYFENNHIYLKVAV